VTVFKTGVELVFELGFGVFLMLDLIFELWDFQSDLDEFVLWEEEFLFFIVEFVGDVFEVEGHAADLQFTGW
jgi:hypothetical protein